MAEEANDFRRVFCPAKLNLFLEIVGKREDGYHDLVSLVTQIDFGDWLGLRLKKEKDRVRDFLRCDVPQVPCDYRNSLIKALNLYRRAYNFPFSVILNLEKNIPLESGLGGASSDAALMIKTLNEMLAQPLTPDEVRDLLSFIGSDVPLFLSSSPCKIFSRGEDVRPLDPENFPWLKRIKFLIFKPIFGVRTKWAYDQLDQNLVKYGREKAASEMALNTLVMELSRPIGTGGIPRFSNIFQEILETKYMELALIFHDLISEFKVTVCPTGSGSSCYIPLMDDYDTSDLIDYLTLTLGDDVFIQEARPLLTPFLSSKEAAEKKQEKEKA